MDACDSTFSNTTTFESLPPALHKPQDCTSLNCSPEPSSAAREGDLLPTHSSDLRGRKLPPTHHRTQCSGASWGLAARDWKLLLDGSLAALVPHSCLS